MKYIKGWMDFDDWTFPEVEEDFDKLRFSIKQVVSDTFKFILTNEEYFTTWLAEDNQLIVELVLGLDAEVTYHINVEEIIEMEIYDGDKKGLLRISNQLKRLNQQVIDKLEETDKKESK